MPRTATERFPEARRLRSTVIFVLVAALWPAALAAQSLRHIVSNQIEISTSGASIELEFGDGSTTTFAIHDGRMWIDGQDVGAATRRGPLDVSFRELLNKAMDASSDALATMLFDWDSPDAGFGTRIDNALTLPADAVEAAADPGAAAAPQDAQMSDSVERLVERIAELQDRIDDAGSRTIVIPDIRDTGRRNPFRHVIRGFEGLFSLSVLYAVLFGIAFATIFFGGRRFIEGVADTARTATTRSLLVGLAASFLVIPAYILGMIALAISIVGILALPVWILLFPVAGALAVLLGYISVAHAAGEALSERRFYSTDWFRRGNSYYFLLTGLGLLLVLFAAGNIVGMAGPWLGFLRGLLFAVAGVVTWAALSIGLGAVLLSRAGTRPMRRAGGAETEPDIFAEATNV
ncbi:MAG: hypothetical protein PVH00_05140 [Gemmatimonadota bacterium]|jgi:hypothetical protein